MISLNPEDAGAEPFCAIGVKMGSLLSVLERAMLQSEPQAIAPLGHHIANRAQICPGRLNTGGEELGVHKQEWPPLSAAILVGLKPSINFPNVSVMSACIHFNFTGSVILYSIHYIVGSALI